MTAINLPIGSPLIIDMHQADTLDCYIACISADLYAVITKLSSPLPDIARWLGLRVSQ